MPKPRTVPGRLIPARAGRTPSTMPVSSQESAHPRSCGADVVVHHFVAVVGGSSPLVRGGPAGLDADLRVGGLIPARAGRTRRPAPSRSSPTAHPRSCGADETGQPIDWESIGSSPLVRGGLNLGVLAGTRRRLIPARAGRTRRPPPRLPGRPAHPRSCGADPLMVHYDTGTSGSSPLVRGGRCQQRTGLRPLRLIPARAGRTASRSRTPSRPTAHPRSCGADIRRKDGRSAVIGSSPLVRGGRERERCASGRGRLIPARAGRTTTATRRQPWAAAHPRSCGADLQRLCVTAIQVGSSPLVRGGPGDRVGEADSPRLIPARAGRTGSRSSAPRCRAAHPRSCGADGTPKGGVGGYLGSSPLVRGGHPARRARRHGRRLIPARAGRTGRGSCRWSSTTAHPRSCGADPPAGTGPVAHVGSSPLVRGGRVRRPDQRRGQRLIPARAGRTASASAAR